MLTPQLKQSKNSNLSPEKYLYFQLLIPNLISFQYLPAGMIHLGLYGTLSIFTISCLIAVIFIVIFVPETKNRSIEEIQEIMSKW
jgi:uncharacterized membrane protein